VAGMDLILSRIRPCGTLFQDSFPCHLSIFVSQAVGYPTRILGGLVTSKMALSAEGYELENTLTHLV
jgi:hypothetical protein